MRTKKYLRDDSVRPLPGRSAIGGCKRSQNRAKTVLALRLAASSKKNRKYFEIHILCVKLMAFGTSLIFDGGGGGWMAWGDRLGWVRWHAWRKAEAWSASRIRAAARGPGDGARGVLHALLCPRCAGSGVLRCGRSAVFDNGAGRVILCGLPARVAELADAPR